MPETTTNEQKKITVSRNPLVMSILIKRSQSRFFKVFLKFSQPDDQKQNPLNSESEPD